MKPFADPQTLSDLNIPGRHKHRSIARMFDTVITAGGRRVMERMFHTPLTDADKITERVSVFQYFARVRFAYPFRSEVVEAVERYLGSGGGHLLSVGLAAARKKLLQVAVHDEAYPDLQDAVGKTMELLKQLESFLDRLPNGGGPCHEEVQAVREVIRHPAFQRMKEEDLTKDSSLLALIRRDHWLRTRFRARMKAVIDFVYRLDVYVAVASVGNARGFTYARVLPKHLNILVLNNLYHPALDHPAGNDLFLNTSRNAIFLTGANMAGKSTLMKAFGICMYLAHMGFPVPASHMLFSVKDGLYTSINVPDNLALGYSHFYAEVLRVKQVAADIAAGRNLVVIFDELFKGTNVKDAYDATLSLTEAFAEHWDSFFVVSTHITEAGEALRARCSNFVFAYLPTLMHGSKPHYTYRLAAGISQDRQGMIIIENEGIIDLIRSGTAGDATAADR